MKKALLCALALAAGLPGAAQAGYNAHPRECIMDVGASQVTLTAFQTPYDHDTYCRNLPNAGASTLILDTEQGELRDMLVEVRILHDVGQKDWRDDVDANTVYHLPPKKYFATKGTFAFDATFPGEGKYITVVRAVSEDGTKEYSGEFGVAVGETLAFYMMLGSGLAALSFVAFGVWRTDGKRPAPSVRKPPPKVAPPPESSEARAPVDDQRPPALDQS